MPAGPDGTPVGPSHALGCPWPHYKPRRGGGQAPCLATRRRTVGPAPDAIGATHRVAANGFKVRVKIRTPGPRRPSHAYRTPSPRE